MTPPKRSTKLWHALLMSALLSFTAACTDEPDLAPEPSDPPVEGPGEDMTVEQDEGDPESDMDAVTQPDPDMDMGPVVVPDMNPDPDMGPVALDATSLIPTSGPLAGGTPFTLEGVGFTQNTVVFFGGAATQVELVDGKLEGVTPEGVAPGPVDVKVLDAERGDDNMLGVFTYFGEMGVDAVSPDRIPTEGNVEVTLTGRGFNEDVRVSFGGVTALRHTVVNETVLRVLAPPRAAGLVDVRATSQDATVVVEQAVTYFETLRIDTVTPSAGPTGGNQAVVLAGAGFEDGMTVRFDGRLAQVQSVAPDGLSASVTTPTGAQGLADVAVETVAGDVALLTDGYYYTGSGALAVGAVAPESGPASGGVRVRVIGAGVGAPGARVLFGGVEASVLESGEGYVVVQTPAGTPGTVDVTVEAGGSSSTLSMGYTYAPDLFIDMVTPAQSDVAGGIEVTLQGEGFTGASRVLLGGVVAAFTVVSDTELKVTVPARSAGVVDVTVERGGLLGRLRDGFTYTQGLEVFGFFPARGSVAGNTYVEIRGRGFVGDMEVSFGGQPAQALEVLDAQTLAVRTPPGQTGTVDVTVTREDDQLIAPDRYTYFNPGARFGGAWGAPVSGAVNVTVYSLGGSAIENAFVMLSTRGETRYQGLTDANGMITLSGPDVYGEQTVTAVAFNHASATVQRVDAENITIFLFEYIPPMPSPPPQGPLPARYTGQLTGLNKIAEPGPSEFRVAFISTTQIDRSRSNPDPGPGASITADGTYTIESRLGDLSLVAVGGLFNTATGEFKPVRMGVRRFLFASEGQTYTENIDLNIELDQTMTVKMNSVPSSPSGPDETRVNIWMDFGFEGVYGELPVKVDAAGASLIQVPYLAKLQNDLSDVTYYVEGGAYTNDDDTPFSIGVRRGVTDLTGNVELPGLLGIAEVTSPAPGDPLVDGLIEWNYSAASKPDLYQVLVVIPTPAGLQPYWDAFLPGTATSVRIPDLPDLSALYPPDETPTPFLGMPFPVLLYAVERNGLEFNEFTYSNFDRDTWDAYSLTIHFVTL
ncbi:MAG: IPT/TIG domain-containing protein [Myxococcota bacterium]